MKKSIQVLGIPILMELCITLVHISFRDALERVQAIDILAFTLTTCVLFYVGWRVAVTYINRVIFTATWIGILFWFIATVVLTGSMTFIRSPMEGVWSAYSGPLMAFILFAPFASLISIGGAFLGKKFNPRT